MLVRSPLVLIFSLYSTLTLGYLLLVVTTLGLLFQNVYGFSVEASGLAYLGMTLGFLISQLTIGPLSDKYIVWVERRHGTRNPEHRLPPLIAGAVILPAGLFCYGWGTHAHWIGPVVGSGLVAVGIMATWLPITLYMVDVFEQHAASALGARTIVLSVCAVLLPLAANPLYDRLGYDWGNSVLAFVAVAFLPFGVLLVVRGKAIRQRIVAPM